MNPRIEFQLQEIQKVGPTLSRLEMQDMLRKLLCNPMQLDDPKLSVDIFPYSSICLYRLFGLGRTRSDGR